MNVILAFFLLFIAFYNIGGQIPQVKSVINGYPAQKREFYLLIKLLWLIIPK
jgi:hypothetical protein